MYNVGAYGGGAVLIGATVAQTITNLYNAVNVVPGYYGVAYTNWCGLPFYIGHEFIAIGCTATDLILTNALDGNTDQYGYPANQQMGVVTSYPLTGTNFVNHQALCPGYAWGNTLNGVSQQFTVGGDLCGNNITNLIKLKRDYFNDVVPSPSTYTPLVYPHPLNILGSGGSNPTPLVIQAGTAKRLNGAFQFAFTNTSTNGNTVTILATTNLLLPLTNWKVIGTVTGSPPGQFQFTDPQATNLSLRFYRVRSP
jgi:hypothetical protein